MTLNPMMRYTFVLMFVFILLQMFNSIQSSTKNYKYSKELDSYDEESSDKTIDVSERDDSTKESAPESIEGDKYQRKSRVGKYNIYGNLEPRLIVDFMNGYVTMDINFLYIFSQRKNLNIVRL